LNQPAGHLEENESLIEAAVRETFEETGWHVEPTHFLGVCVLKAENNVTYVRHTFVAKPVRFDENQPLDTGIIGTKWLSLDEIIQVKDQLRSHMVITTNEQYLNGQLHPLSLVTSLV
jgi:8-oxo-dGTP pyrophosphatase MutT (NUDIX family)